MIKNLFVWLMYSCLMSVILIPVIGVNIKLISIGVVLGFFAGILNEIRNK